MSLANTLMRKPSLPDSRRTHWIRLPHSPLADTNCAETSRNSGTPVSHASSYRDAQVSIFASRAHSHAPSHAPSIFSSRRGSVERRRLDLPHITPHLVLGKPAPKPQKPKPRNYSLAPAVKASHSKVGLKTLNSLFIKRLLQPDFSSGQEVRTMETEESARGEPRPLKYLNLLKFEQTPPTDHTGPQAFRPKVQNLALRLRNLKYKKHVRALISERKEELASRHVMKEFLELKKSETHKRVESADIANFILADPPSPVAAPKQFLVRRKMRRSSTQVIPKSPSHLHRTDSAVSDSLEGFLQKKYSEKSIISIRETKEEEAVPKKRKSSYGGGYRKKARPRLKLRAVRV